MSPSMRWISLLALAAAIGCTPDAPPDLDPVHPCDQPGAHLDLAPPGGDFGDLSDGSELWCGNPPQGGAPYTPFRLRFAGPEAFEDGVMLEMRAVDVDSGEELALTTLTMGVTCANVGESEGFWVGSEAHMRYEGWSLDELAGRGAELAVTARAIDDPTLAAESSVEVELVLER